MSDDRGVSRRALFGLGFSRAADELPTIPAGLRRRPRPARSPSWGDLRPAARADTLDPLDDQLGAIAAAVVGAGEVADGSDVLVVGAADGRVAQMARERGASVTCAPAAETIAHAGDSFDSVLSAFGVVYAERRDRALAELFRVVRPDGMVSIAAWTRSGFMGPWFALAGRHVLPPTAPEPTDWGRAQTMREELEPHAGSESRFDAQVVTLEFASPAAAWLAFSHLPGPVSAGIARLAPDARAAMEAEFLRMLPAADEDGRVDVDVRVQLIAARAL